MNKKEFNVRKAAYTIFKIMKQMGVNVNKSGHNSWVNYFADEPEHVTICLRRNAIRCSVTKDGVSFRSSYGSPGWSARSTSLRKFKKNMQHVLFYMR